MEAKFVGKYTKFYHNLMQAAIVSKSNVFVQSDPGWGKTEMALVASQQSFGEGGYLYLRLDPSVPPDVLSGSYNPAALLEGKLERVIDNTPYDPRVKLVIFDEISRANDPLYDAAIHVCDMKNVTFVQRPIFIATSNFPLKGERTEALRDRFPFWYKIQGDLDVEDLVMARCGLNGHNAFSTSFLSEKELLDIWTAKPDQKSAKAIASLLTGLQNEAIRKNLVVNPRRISQWLDIVFYNTVFQTGNASFARIPDKVTSLLAWAYPAKDDKEAQVWRQIVSAVADMVKAAIEAYRAELKAKYDKLTQATPSGRAAAANELSALVQNASKELSSLYGDDPRVAEFKKEMTEIFVKAVKGQEL